MLLKLKMKIRKHLPEPIKKVLRGLSLIIKAPPPSSPKIPQICLHDCKFIADRKEMLNHLPANANVAEIGTLHGDFAHEILVRTNPQSLKLIDLDFSTLHAHVRNNEKTELFQGQSTTILDSFENQALDWIYVDGDHSYEGVCRDIEKAKSKIKPGGYLVFNDFGRISRRGLGVFGVHQAVCEFIDKEQWNVKYFCFNTEALYDIAIQKPNDN